MSVILAGNSSPHALPSLHLPPQAETLPKTFIGRFLLSARPAAEPENAEKVYPWYVVLWLTGVDYFSTLFRSTLLTKGAPPKKH